MVGAARRRALARGLRPSAARTRSQRPVQASTRLPSARRSSRSDAGAIAAAALSRAASRARSSRSRVPARATTAASPAPGRRPRASIAGLAPSSAGRRSSCRASRPGVRFARHACEDARARPPSRQHLLEQDPDGEDVVCARDLASFALLGAQRRERADVARRDRRGGVGRRAPHRSRRGARPRWRRRARWPP